MPAGYFFLHAVAVDTREKRSIAGRRQQGDEEQSNRKSIFHFNRFLLLILPFADK